jgi:hypothetical protein
MIPHDAFHVHVSNERAVCCEVKSGDQLARQVIDPVLVDQLDQVVSAISLGSDPPNIRVKGM